MKREQFEELVRKYEAFARQDPAGYRKRVALFGMLGYAYIFLVLAIALGLLIGVAALMFSAGRFNVGGAKVALLLLFFCGLILRSLWVTVEAPEGMAVSRAEVPKLYEMVDDLTRKLSTPRFDKILLINDYNAAAAQRPRLGIFGWQENYLLFGVPYMLTMTPEQFQMTVAHELGHLSGNHSRFGGWIYRLEQSWAQLLSNLQEQGSGNWIFEPFFRWYIPRFRAMSFALRRQNEYEADLDSAIVSGTEAAAACLMTEAVRGEFLGEHYWKPLIKQVEEAAHPPAPFSGMAGVLRRERDRAQEARWLRKALYIPTGYADTHPSLSDRIAALGHPVTPEQAEAVIDQVGAPPVVSAAELYLGERLPDILARMDQEWIRSVAPRWKERHEQTAEAREALAALERRAGEGPLTEEEEWERVGLTGQVQGNVQAIALLEAMHLRAPDDPRVCYTLGQALLEERDERGVALLEQAAVREPRAAEGAFAAIYDYLLETDRPDEARKYRKRLEEHADIEVEAAAERAGFAPKDRLLPHGLSAEELEKLRASLAACAKVKEAYLARKEVRYFPERPYFVLGVVPLLPRIRLDTDWQLLWNEIATATEMPGETYLILRNEQTRAHFKALQKVEGSEVFKRS